MSDLEQTQRTVVRQLRAVRGQVSDDRRRRAEYSSDAGNYRVVPQVVVEPLDVDDVLATLAISRESGVPVTSRGGGTSVAGNAIGAGIVLDFARHPDPILQITSKTAPRTATGSPEIFGDGWPLRVCGSVQIRPPTPEPPSAA